MSGKTQSQFKVTDPAELPRDAKLLSLVLEAANVDDYEPIVIPQLLEMTYRYVLDVLQDAQVFSEHAGRKDIALADVRLAIENRVCNSFNGPPSKEVMYDIAQQKNSIPLPLITEKFGLRLPPERNTLTRQNFAIVPQKRLTPSTNPIDLSNIPAFITKNASSADLPLSQPVHHIAPPIQITNSNNKKQDEDDDYDMDQ